MNRSSIFATLQRLCQEASGSTSVIFALSIIPVAISAGAAYDITRANGMSAKAQAALDAAVISAVQLPVAQQSAYALSIFTAQSRGTDNETGTPAFTSNPDGTLSGAVTLTMPTTMMKLAGKSEVVVTLRAKASKQIFDDSCILARAGGMTATSDAIKLNGGSNLNFSGCTLYSNASMVCNGSTAVADAAVAVGVSSKCANSRNSASPIPDIYGAQAANITKLCGITTKTFNWAVGSMPSMPNMITSVNAKGITEYHVCGNVTVTGNGTLLGNASEDSILVIENGSFTIANNANITLTRTTLVITASVTTGNHFIDFPQGNGKSATLRISPSSSSVNPFQGIGIYQDPALTSGINFSWGPGASLYADGVLYFPNASMTVSGIANSNGSNCTKLVVRDLTSNGAVNFSQNATGCDGIGMKKYMQPSQLLL